MCSVCISFSNVLAELSHGGVKGGSRLGKFIIDWWTLINFKAIYSLKTSIIIIVKCNFYPIPIIAHPSLPPLYSLSAFLHFSHLLHILFFRNQAAKLHRTWSRLGSSTFSSRKKPFLRLWKVHFSPTNPSKLYKTAEIRLQNSNCCLLIECWTSSEDCCGKLTVEHKLKLKLSERIRKEFRLHVNAED